MILRLRHEGGYTLVELLTVTMILSVVVTGLTTLFVSGSNAELDMNNRFQAQQAARLSLDKLRREVHCASSVTPAGASTSVTISLPSQCAGTGGVPVTVIWCAVTSPTASSQWALYRSTGATCSSSSPSALWADYLTSQNVFNFTLQSTQSLAKLNVSLKVNLKPAQTARTFALQDDIVLRNSSRTCIAGSPSPPCP